jgi:hypothetical protein
LPAFVAVLLSETGPCTGRPGNGGSLEHIVSRYRGTPSSSGGRVGGRRDDVPRDVVGLARGGLGEHGVGLLDLPEIL